MDSLNVERVLLHLDFLRAVDVRGDQFYDPDFARVAANRYERFWLPLVAEAIKDQEDVEVTLAPPPG